MTVEFIKQPAPMGLAYFVGDVVDIPNEALAHALIEDGIAKKSEKETVNKLSEKK